MGPIVINGVAMAENCAGLVDEFSSDEQWAKSECARRDLTYLSHETYKTGASHQVWIAVQDGHERFELKLNRK